MNMDFNGIHFELSDEKIYLTNLMGFASMKEGEDISLFKFVECQLAGENHAFHCGAKQLNCSETNRMIYSSYAVKENKLEIITKGKGYTNIANFQSYDDCKVIRVWNTFDNNKDEEDIIIENLSSLRFAGIGEEGSDSLKDINVYVFHNSWHVECQVSKHNLFDDCFYNGNIQSMKRFLISNTGSWSTKEYLPLFVIEDTKKKKFLMIQIESSSSWSFEIGDEGKHLYLNVGGANQTDNQCSVKVAPGGEFQTKRVAFVIGDSINEVIQEMTKYRRHIVKENIKDAELPIIFNEYMHLSWDGPRQDRTEMIAEKIKDFGAKYYVIDCGWHDECIVDDLYRKCGKWKESSIRFPRGVKKTAIKMKSCGMKMGLWIEPEVIGCDNQEMINYYGEDAFFHRNGKPIIQSSRLFLDFRNPKVIDYLNKTLDTMISNYGANYIKFDYNQDCGAGTEKDAISLGEGLLKSSNAYKDWVASLMEKYPQVIFETCSSGGCRMDYETLSSFCIVSTSDQTNFRKYPYIASNILSAVLPEQAGVWAYPVDCINGTRLEEEGIEEYVDSQTSKEQVAMNMVNALLGRMHLAGAVYLLSKEKQEIVKEGIHYYNSITKAKKNGLPYLPLGFSHFGDPHVASGFIANKKLYLAVWNLDGDKNFAIPLEGLKAKDAHIAFPSYSEAKIRLEKNRVSLEFKHALDCAFLEIELV